MDSLVPAAQAETTLKKGGLPPKSKSVNKPKPVVVADTAYIVTFLDPNNQLTTQAQVENLATTIAGSITFDQVYFEGTKGFSAVLTLTQANTFRNDARVEFVEIDGPIYPTQP